MRLLVRVGAGDGIRTRDIQRGRLALYQLSYTRKRRFWSLHLKRIERRQVRNEGFETERSEVLDVKSGWKPDFNFDTRDIQRGRLALYQLSYTRATGFVVGREGFEPSKAGGRQVYSLLRLTASLPPHELLFTNHERLRGRPFKEVELAEGIEPPTRSLQNCRSTPELRQRRNNGG